MEVNSVGSLRRLARTSLRRKTWRLVCLTMVMRTRCVVMVWFEEEGDRRNEVFVARGCG